MWGGPKNGK
jgi:DNA topoisomerase IA